MDSSKYIQEVSLLEGLLQQEKSKVNSETEANNEVIKDMAAVAAKLKRELDHVKVAARVESEKQQAIIQSQIDELEAIQIRYRHQQDDLSKAESEVIKINKLVLSMCYIDK